MSDYGIKILNEDGDGCYLNSDIGTMISAGRLTMPTVLVDTNKYYGTVSLPASIPVADLSVLITPVKWDGRFYREYAHTTPNYYWLQTKMLDDTYSYYTKNLSTGDMTYFVPGKCSKATTSSDWNLVCSIYPEIYWDKFSDTEVTDVKMFGAMRYLSHDVSDGFIDLYQLGSNGVNQLDYIIEMRRRVA